MTEQEKQTIGGLLRDLAMLARENAEGRVSVEDHRAHVDLVYQRIEAAFPTAPATT